MLVSVQDHTFLPGKLGEFWKPTTCIAALTVADPDPACAGSSLEAEMGEAHEEEQASSRAALFLGNRQSCLGREKLTPSNGDL